MSYIFRLFDHATWMSGAPCAGRTEDFYGPPARTSDSSWAAKAKVICSTCTHRQQCLDFAIQNNEDFGVWGGMSVRERREFAHNRRAVVSTTDAHRNVSDGAA